MNRVGWSRIVLTIWNPSGAQTRMVGGCWGLFLNSFPPWQNGRHFADDIFKFVFLNGNVWISHNISLKFVLSVQINNIQALFQIMAWHWPGDKPLSQPMLTQFTDTYDWPWLLASPGHQQPWHCVDYGYSCLLGKWISTTCDVSELRNDVKCKLTYVYTEKWSTTRINRPVFVVLDTLSCAPMPSMTGLLNYIISQITFHWSIWFTLKSMILKWVAIDNTML